ncbi:MAG: nucleotidyltransferase domain-containing protein [Spirochaetia bacterium]|nr:nucleotidyltransferase domain-containing protein [Spirochaetia bacterium]
MITKDKINQIVKIIIEKYMPDKIILFGSYAKGAPQKDSDLDLLVIKDVDLPRHKRAVEIRKYLRGISTPLDILVYTNSEIKKWKDLKTSFISNALEEGKPLYVKER